MRRLVAGGKRKSAPSAFGFGLVFRSFMAYGFPGRCWFERSCGPACLIIVSINPTKAYMKKTIVLLTGIAGLFLLAYATPTMAADDDAGKKVTVTGMGKCAKCALKETDSCQNVIEAEENGKKVTYYLAKNDISKDFHSNICKEAKKVKATGTVKEVDGKKELTVSKISLADKTE